MESQRDRSMFVIDATPHYLLNNINENENLRNIQVMPLFEDFSVEELKSVLFLLMDYITPDRYLNLAHETKENLLRELFATKIEDYDKLVELLGTMKKFKKLKLLKTCRHEYEQRKFSSISPFWKMLYMLCEELTDRDFEKLKERIPNSIKPAIRTPEDWFCWFYKNKRFSETDLSDLELIFKDYSRCVDIIKKFEEESKYYHIRTPTDDSPCGIALIINNDTFDDDDIQDREGSQFDVGNLEKLWKTFGFKIETCHNLTYSETIEKFKYYASLDHSNYDIFVCCILSHGKSKSIYSNDGKLINIPSLKALITNKCPSLQQKPKLFFIQACQGSYYIDDSGKPVKHFGSQESLQNNVKHSAVGASCNRGLEEADMSNVVEETEPPVEFDTLTVTSSINEFVSYRNTKTGSWFIQSLCELMIQRGDKHSILDIMIDVNKKVRELSSDGNSRNPRQITDCSNNFEKILILKRCISKCVQ